MTTLLDTLSSDDAAAVAGRCDDLRAHHLRFRAAELRALLDDAASEPGGAELPAQLSALSGPALLRVLEGPETLAHLLAFHRGRRARAVEFLSLAIRAERVREGEPPPASGCWTALGDRHAHPDRAPYHAPTVEGCIIDVRSPFGRHPPGASRRDLGAPLLPRLDAPPSDGDEEAVVPKLRATLQALGLVSPAALALVTGSLVTILPRPSRGTEPAFTSVSSRPRVGSATLVDAAAPGVSRARIAGALLHEAIHSYLYRLELAVPLVDCPRTATQATVRSPWTGSELRLNTYVHACFVYFALVSLWRRAEARRFFDPAQVELLASRAASGFAGGEHLARLRAHRPHLHRVVDEQLARMTDRLDLPTEAWSA
ncbi:MAG: HEXXH motif-containing putative peptide modification protein [Nannocystaceae bacterium]